jgi:hypothetical protein
MILHFGPDLIGSAIRNVGGTPDRADEALGDRVRPWRARRCLEDLDVDGGEYGVEGGSELAVAVADEEPEASVGVVEVHEQVAGLLGQPGSGRVRGDAQDVYPTGGVLDDEERPGAG